MLGFSTTGFRMLWNIFLQGNAISVHKCLLHYLHVELCKSFLFFLPSSLSEGIEVKHLNLRDLLLPSSKIPYQILEGLFCVHAQNCGYLAEQFNVEIYFAPTSI